MHRFTLHNLLSAVSGEAIGFERPEAGFVRVELDSRAVRGGELFWAVRGQTHDGHDFAAEALRRGAAACIVGRSRAAGIDGPRVVVEDTLDALGRFARRHRRTHGALIVGVTGSVGKTTTREMIHATLSAGFPGTRSPRNFNNQFGLPLSLLEIEPHHRFAVLEMAASRVGEIAALAGIALPEVGVVTAVGLAHVEKFGGEEQIIQAKGELVEALPAMGLAVLAGDDPRVRGMARRAACRTLLIGEGPENHLRATHIETHNDRIAFRVDGDWYEVFAVGRHHLTAALAAIAVARENSMRTPQIAAGLRTFVPAPGRCRVERTGPWTVIDDTYNASPESMRAACRLLQNWTGAGRRVLVVGDMLELGERSAECHRQLGRTAAASGIDALLALGNQATHVIDGAHESGMDTHRAIACNTLGELLASLEELLTPTSFLFRPPTASPLRPLPSDATTAPGAVVLVKGSRGMKMERVVEWLRTRSEQFNEHTSRAAARACV